MSFDYQKFATLSMSLNRQKYGPLDISAVFASQEDMDWYRSKGTTGTPSDYWKDTVPYPYSGQLVALVNYDTVAKKASVVFYYFVENEQGLYDAEVLGSASAEELSQLATQVSNLATNVSNLSSKVTDTEAEIDDIYEVLNAVEINYNSTTDYSGNTNLASVKFVHEYINGVINEVNNVLSEIVDGSEG